VPCGDAELSWVQRKCLKPCSACRVIRCSIFANKKSKFIYHSCIEFETIVSWYHLYESLAPSFWHDKDIHTFLIWYEDTLWQLGLLWKTTNYKTEAALLVQKQRDTFASITRVVSDIWASLWLCLFSMWDFDCVSRISYLAIISLSRPCSRQHCSESSTPSLCTYDGMCVWRIMASITTHLLGWRISNRPVTRDCYLASYSVNQTAQLYDASVAHRLIAFPLITSCTGSIKHTKTRHSIKFMCKSNMTMNGVDLPQKHHRRSRVSFDGYGSMVWTEVS